VKRIALGKQLEESSSRTEYEQQFAELFVYKYSRGARAGKRLRRKTMRRRPYYRT
jgi:hypothetical protein